MYVLFGRGIDLSPWSGEAGRGYLRAEGRGEKSERKMKWEQSEELHNLYFSPDIVGL
jgi:hypothetical protein